MIKTKVSLASSSQNDASGLSRMVPFTLLLLLLLFISGCGSTSTSSSTQKQDVTSNTNQSITYGTNPQDVVLRTFYGGSLSGTFQLGPRISLYGDGTYTIGLDHRGQLNSDEMQKLLSTLVDTDGLLTLTQQQFFDIPDQSATYLELMLNGKTHELVYGNFGNQPETQASMNEYQRLGKALQTLTETLNGGTQLYTATDYTLLARQISFVSLAQQIPYWPLPDFTLYELSTFECGAVPEDTTSTNKEIGCLKYTIPNHALLISAEQYATVRAQLPLDQPAIFREGGFYYEVTARPLLPDEKSQKALAMFGGSQLTYKSVPLQSGPIPQGSPTP